VQRAVVDDHTRHRDGTRQIFDAYPDLQIIEEASSGELASN
jgi:DNA-binding NarL/FixJ family response regulator